MGAPSTPPAPTSEMQLLFGLIYELKGEIADLKTIIRGGKISDAWISEKDAAGLLGMQPRTLRRQATKETDDRLPFAYRNTNGRAYQYKRADITAYLRQTSVPA